jgi:hypothetical protein
MKEHNQHDQEIDTVLRALREAVPPAGMDARIVERLQRQAPASPATGTWWRGAIAGAAFTLTLAVCVVLLLLHGARPTPRHANATANDVVSSMSPVNFQSNSVAHEDGGQPCASPSVLHAGSIVRKRNPQSLHTLHVVRSHPAPEMPLTTEERELVRLAHSADPKQLAAPDPETQAKLEAQESAEFLKFFEPPAPPPTTHANQ